MDWISRIFFFPLHVLPISRSLFSFSDAHLTQKSTVITRSSHVSTGTNSSLSETDYDCLATLHVSSGGITSITHLYQKQKSLMLEYIGTFVNETILRTTVMS